MRANIAQSAFAAEVLNQSRQEEVIIRRCGGESFAIVPRVREGSPFDIPGVKTRATAADVLAAVRESRAKSVRQRHSRRR
jgi:hypothetical protein